MRARNVAVGALAVWGVVHVLGGVSLLAAEPADALRTLGPGSGVSTPDDVMSGVIRFHALNIALGGIGVTILAWLAHGGRSWAGWSAVAIAVALDVGLLIFLVGPGILPATEGSIGPVLAAAAVIALVAARRREAVA